MNFVKYQPQIYNGNGFDKYDFYTYLGENQFQKYDTYVASESQATNEVVILIQVTSGLEIVLPFSANYNCMVNWGDGLIKNYVHDGMGIYQKPSHIYQTGGDYIIKITGYARYFDLKYGSESDKINLRNSLKEVIYFGDIGTERISFKGCTNLIKVHQIYAPSATSVDGLFEDCINLTITSIPSGLFDSFINVTNISYAFSGCTYLTSIPSGLFYNMNKVVSIEAVFFACINLQTIPNGLFNSFINVTNSRYIFYNCTNLTSIPNGLFNSFINVTNLSYAFYNCRNLTGNAPELWNKVNPTPSGSQCFYNCTKLSNYAQIPASWK